MDLKLAELPPLERYKLLRPLTRCTKIGGSFLGLWPKALGDDFEQAIGIDDRNIARPAVGLQRG